MVRTIIGRERELAALSEFLSGIADRPVALAIEGDAGAGKTTLWTECSTLARTAGLVVLNAQPVAAEAKLSFAALGDLLRDVADVGSSLPEPQRKALRTALLLEEAGGAPPDAHAVALATLGVLEGAAGTHRTLLAIDDVQWLDPASAEALRFALRRLHGLPLGVLTTRRVERGSSDPLALDRSFPDLLRLVLGPLTLDDLDRLLRERLGTRFLRPTLRRLHQTCGGNPFFALELGRALADQDAEVRPGVPLPVPASLQELVRGRLARLPAASRAALLAASAHPVPTRELIEGAVGSRRAAIGLTRAVEAGVIALEDDTVRFDHPLLASVLYSGASDEERRRLHRRLATLVRDSEERGRHLALAVTAPDQDAAAALDEAATSARSRGATDAAAELAEEALRYTAPNDVSAAHRRALQAGGFAFEAGDTVRARRLLDRAITTARDGPSRVRALDALARVWMFADDLREARRLFAEALRIAGGDQALRAESEQGIAWTLWLIGEDYREAARHARAAVRHAEQAGDRALLARGLAIQGLARCTLGERGALADLDRAVRLEEATKHLRVLRQPTFAWALAAGITDDLQGARSAIEELRRRARERGDEASTPVLLSDLAELALMGGAWIEAARLCDEAIDASLQRGEGLSRMHALGVRARIDAGRGLEAPTRDTATAGTVAAERVGSTSELQTCRAALGLLELSLGKPEAALGHLLPAVEYALRARIGEPGAACFVPDAIEALMLANRLDEAEVLLSDLEERARKLGRASALAAAGRCRGLLLAARGDHARALACFEMALEQHARVHMPFELARTLFARGSVERRAGKRRAATESLQQARAIFEELGATLWAANTNAELARIGGRPPTRAGELTAAELRIAELVAAGHSNQEVADALFLSVRTVEWNLSKIFRKLGLRSRTELAASLIRSAADTRA